MLFLETPQRPPKKILFETPDSLQQSLSRFKDTGLFLSPATEKFHKSIEKATKLSEVVYNSWKLKEVQKNIIQSIDHILNHSIVCEHPAAANFVGMVERNMREIKEEFNKVVLSIFESNIGKDNKVCFPSYKNKKKTQVEKRYKGIAG
jgi:DNA polymerase III delta subunit